MEYPKEQLNDPRWLAKRNEILSRDSNTCLSCGRSDARMHVHHIEYLPMKDLWDYPNWMLITYCDKCHETEHLIGNDISESLLELIKTNYIYVKPLAQITVLIEKYPPFHVHLKKFLNKMMMEYLRQMEALSKSQ
jgi:hypothetical protein